jgi:hypothetical protein
MKRILNGLWIALAFGGVAFPQTPKTAPAICLHIRMYEATGAERTLDPDDAYPKDNPVTTRWTELGYRVVRPCVNAQIQLELDIRFIGPAKDPESKVKLTVTGKSVGRTESFEIPYSGGFRTEEEQGKAGGMIGPAAGDVLLRLDPTYKARAVEYGRKHPE